MASAVNTSPTTSLHYRGYPAVQIRVDCISADELRERLEDAWLIQEPKRLAKAYLDENEGSG